MRGACLSSVLCVLQLVSPVTMSDQVYHNQFAVHVEGGKEVADKLAEKMGFVNTGQIGALDDHYLWEAHHIEKRCADR